MQLIIQLSTRMNMISVMIAIHQAILVSVSSCALNGVHTRCMKPFGNIDSMDERMNEIQWELSRVKVKATWYRRLMYELWDFFSMIIQSQISQCLLMNRCHIAESNTIHTSLNSDDRHHCIVIVMIWRAIDIQTKHKATTTLTQYTIHNPTIILSQVAHHLLAVEQAVVHELASSDSDRRCRHGCKAVCVWRGREVFVYVDECVGKWLCFWRGSCLGRWLVDGWLIVVCVRFDWTYFEKPNLLSLASHIVGLFGGNRVWDWMGMRKYDSERVGCVGGIKLFGVVGRRKT